METSKYEPKLLFIQLIALVLFATASSAAKMLTTTKASGAEILIKIQQKQINE